MAVSSGDLARDRIARVAGAPIRPRNVVDRRRRHPRQPGKRARRIDLAGDAEQVGAQQRQETRRQRVLAPLANRKAADLARHAAARLDAERAQNSDRVAGAVGRVEPEVGGESRPEPCGDAPAEPRRLFEDCYPAPLASQQGGRGQAAEAAADDGDVQSRSLFCHRCLQCFCTLHDRRRQKVTRAGLQRVYCFSTGC